MEIIWFPKQQQHPYRSSIFCINNTYRNNLPSPLVKLMHSFDTNAVRLGEGGSLTTLKDKNMKRPEVSQIKNIPIPIYYMPTFPFFLLNYQTNYRNECSCCLKRWFPGFFSPQRFWDDLLEIILFRHSIVISLFRCICDCVSC